MRTEVYTRHRHHHHRGSNQNRFVPVSGPLIARSSHTYAFFRLIVEKLHGNT